MNKEKEFKIDPQYKVISRLIDTDGVDDIEACSLKYVNLEVNYETNETNEKRTISEVLRFNIGAYH